MSLSFLDGFAAYMMLLPMLLLGVTLANMLARVIVRAKKNTSKHVRKLQQHRVHEISVIFTNTVNFVLYPGLCLSIFKVLQCRTVLEQDPKQYLMADYSVECFGGEHSAFVALSMVCIFVFVLGIPLATFVVLFRHRKNLDDKRIQNKYGSLYLHFEPAWWFFELVDNFRRMLLTGGLVLAGYGTTGQLLAGVVISLAYLLITTRAAPYKSDVDDSLAFICNLQQLLMYIIGLGLKSEQGAADNGAASSYSDVVFTSIVNAMTIMVICIGVLTILSIPCNDRIERFLQRCNGGTQKESGSGNTKIAPQSVGAGVVSVREWKVGDPVDAPEAEVQGKK